MVTNSPIVENVMHPYSRTVIITVKEGVHIDGVILENVKITGKENSIYTDSIFVGGLVGIAIDSYISNIKVTGEVKNGLNVGGIAGYIQNTTLINSSFEGGVSNGNYIGGLVGGLISLNIGEEIRGNIISSYAVANLSGGYSLDEEKSRIGGLAGEIRDGLIKSSFYTGTIDYSDSNYASPIALGMPNRCTFEDVYYTFNIPKESEYRGCMCSDKGIYYIDEKDLKSGIPLKGLEDFIFEVGKMPRIKNSINKKS